MNNKELATMMAHIMGNQYAIMELLADAHSTDEDSRTKLLQATINRGQEYAANLLPLYLKATGSDLGDISDN